MSSSIVTPSHLFLRIDWALLREQKAYCLNEAFNRPDTVDVYEGLIALLDNLQDTAVACGLIPRDIVFGPEEGGDGEM
ncbi:MAG: hypothetical protein EKK46_10900 [Rhodocyclaceae bacterium]|nr:MAG: hypothetical protein EKK46_10900 [Rhodocyclaceae bacterium]